jgi:hypothetical protein
MFAPFLVAGTRGGVSYPLLLASASVVRGMRIFKTHSYPASKRILVGKLVDEISRITPKREVGSVVVAVVGVGAGTVQTLAVAVFFFDAVVASAIGAAGGRAEGVQWDVGGLACAVTADVERNFGGRRGCSGPSPRWRWWWWFERTELLRKAECRWDGMWVGTRR